MLEPRIIPSMLARCILKCRPYSRGPFRKVLDRLWSSNRDPVKVRVHGFETVLNAGNNYPILVQDHRWFNAPLVELCHQAFLTNKEPCVMLDVGAATGDSVLLIKARCPGAIKKFICIEGDEEFYEIASSNMRQFADVTVVKALLARELMTIKSLIKHHKGTAAAIGEEAVEAVRLDSLDVVQQAVIDVMKVDVDGFDGEVLEGAAGILKASQPAVIFEWHPKLAVQTGNDPLRAFAALTGMGFNRFLWFNNPGMFSHFSGPCAFDVLRKQADYLIKVNERADEHFDVIALPESSQINEVALAGMEHARACADCR